MTLGDFRKLTKGLDDSTRIIIPGTSPRDLDQQYDVSEMIVHPHWSCGELAQSALLLRSVRCDPRFAALTRLGESGQAEVKK